MIPFYDLVIFHELLRSEPALYARPSYLATLITSTSEKV